MRSDPASNVTTGGDIGPHLDRVRDALRIVSGLAREVGGRAEAHVLIALLEVALEGSLDQAALAAKIGVSRQTASRIAGHLGSGYLDGHGELQPGATMVRAETHGRRRHLSLTPYGRRTMKRLLGP